MKRYRSYFLVLLIYTLLTIVMTWPAAAQLGTHIPGKIGDAYVRLWTFNWVKESLIAGQSPYFTTLQFYPQGVSLFNHNISWVQIAVWLPLQTLFGTATAYTLIFLAAFPLNAFSTYLLAQRLLKSDQAAFIAGLIVGFWPYNLSHHGHPNLVLICWIPFSLFFLDRLFEHNRLRDALGAGISMALIGLTRWQLLVISSFLIGAFIIYKLSHKEKRSRQTLKQLIVATAVSLLLMLPLLLPVLNYQLNREQLTDVLPNEEFAYPTDLLAYTLPSRYHPVWGEAVANISRGFIGNNVYTRAIGYTVILLAGYGCIKNGRKARFWGIVALIYLLLALGPQLYINGRATLPMPYKLIENIFIIQTVRFPDRFNVLLGIPVAMMAALGSMAISDKVIKARYSQLVTLIISLFIIGEYTTSFATLPLQVSDWYQEIAVEDGQFAILDLPIHSNLAVTSYLYFQLSHGKPLVGGRIARPPQEAYAFINSIPLLTQVFENEKIPGEIDDVSHQLQLLAENNVRYIVLHKPFLSPDKIKQWRDWFVFMPSFEDETLIVYRTTPELGQDFSLSYPFTDRPRIGLIETTLAPISITQGGWVEIVANWGAEGPVDTDYAVCLNLVRQSGGTADSQCRPLSEDRPTSRWQANEIVRANYAIPIDPFLAAGPYDIQLSLTDPVSGQQIGRTVPIGAITIESLPRTFTPPELAQPVEANWENIIQLTGYEQGADCDYCLNLTLYWHALQRPESSYKVFLHVRHHQSGELMTQLDYIPRDWTYPTNWWEKGEYIADTILIDLTDIPPGEYELWAGLYEAANGERLTIRDLNDNKTAVDAIRLLTFQHDG